MNYAASKAGLETMTRVLALELGRKGILANCVAPGVIETKMSERIRQTHEGALLDTIAVRRFGKPEEVAEVVAFIASDASTYVTGQVIRVDGGMGL
jgi:3-oxoacyl-[acyl-carrier protein] reductase